MSHELTDPKEMSSYFANKFHPARPVYVVGRSYKAEPKCKPQETLFDNWMDRSHSHTMSPHCHSCIMPSCVSIVHHVCECRKSCLSLPPDRAHACQYGSGCCMRHPLRLFPRLPSLLLPLSSPVVVSCDRYVVSICSNIQSTLHALTAMHAVSCHCSSLPPCSEDHSCIPFVVQL